MSVGVSNRTDHLEPCLGWVAKPLRQMTDSDLDGAQSIIGNLREILEGRGEESTAELVGALAFFINAERDDRKRLLWNAQADLAGGHKVVVSTAFADDDAYQAWCEPEWVGDSGNRMCWEGPQRATLEEAVEDGRAHHPGHEPELWAVGEEG